MRRPFALEPQWRSRALAELIAHPPMIEFLETLLGEDIVFTRGLFTRTLSGSPPISLHTDGQPFGSSIFGYEGSCPRLLRVLYYLDDLTPERAPFRLCTEIPPVVSRGRKPLRALQIPPG